MNQIVAKCVLTTMKDLHEFEGQVVRPLSLLERGIGALLLVIALSACTSTLTWEPLAGPHSLELGDVSTAPMSAELEFDAIVDTERLRLDGVWVSEGPDRFRLELRAPTGGVIFAVATDGDEITCYDARAGKYFVGSANAKTFDLLLPVAPLSLTSEQWLSLLLGAFNPPKDATYERSGNGSLRARFRQGSNQVSAVFDPKGFLAELNIGHGEANHVTVGYSRRDGRGRSLQTLIEDSSGAHRMRMRLHDLREAEGFSKNVFRIKQPRNVETISL